MSLCDIVYAVVLELLIVYEKITSIATLTAVHNASLWRILLNQDVSPDTCYQDAVLPCCSAQTYLYGFVLSAMQLQTWIQVSSIDPIVITMCRKNVQKIRVLSFLFLEFEKSIIYTRVGNYIMATVFSLTLV